MWRSVRPVVRRRLSHDDGRAAYALGGGTILAARWRHRHSTDVDLLTSDPRGALLEIARTGRGMVTELGGELAVGSNRNHARMQLESGALDVSVMTLHPAGAETSAVVDGEVETVLSNAQILYGKLQRTDRSPVRDLYDVMTAADADPRGLETAVREYGAAGVRFVGSAWRHSARRFAAETGAGGPRFAGVSMEDVCSRAADAIESAVARVLAEDGRSGPR